MRRQGRRSYGSHVPRTAIINVVGLCRRCLGDSTPFLNRYIERSKLATIRPQVPAVTCTMQATYLTGTSPSHHGIVGNGWYDRELAEHQFWKQSNHIVHGKKLWESIRDDRPGYTCAKLFWWYNMYSSADYSATPRPMYPADGRKVFDIYTHPMDLRESLKSELGPFPFHTFWGPAAGLPCSQWIANCAKSVEQRVQPDLSLIYLPHLDYNFQRFGPDLSKVSADLLEIDQLLADLVTYLENRDIQVLLLSEYGITPVNRAIHLNREFRKQGWITTKDELGREILDLGASQVFAIADHQMAHVYVNDRDLLAPAQQLCQSIPGVEQVLVTEARRDAGLDHDRAGDLVLVSDANSWFTYYYWEDDAVAPDFARCVDIHRKPGYDPVELFLDPKITLPKLKIASKLLKKKLGMRMLMDLIPLDATLVKGSHGRIPEDQEDWPVLIGPLDAMPETLQATEVHDALRSVC